MGTGMIGMQWIIFIGVAVVSWLVQMNLQSKFKKYSKIPTGNGMTGADVALKMLHDNGIYDVTVTHTPGHLTDHYNPANKTVNLSESVYNSNSIMAAAVAAHECGHAIQHAHGYAPMNIRAALVPVAFRPPAPIWLSGTAPPGPATPWWFAKTPRGCVRPEALPAVAADCGWGRVGRA